MKELLDHTKNIRTPSNTIYFKAPFSGSRRFVEYFASTLPLVRLGDIVASIDIKYDPNDEVSRRDNVDASIVEIGSMFTPQTDQTASNFVARLLMNMSVMHAKHLTPPIVRRLLQKRFGNIARVWSSETNEVEWIIRIRLLHVSLMMQPFQNNVQEREGLLVHRVINTFLDTIAVSGHMDIQSSTLREISEDGHTRFVVDTIGCNMVDVSAAASVDWHRTLSNDVHEVHGVLGIEAATCVLYSELNTTISFDGTYVDPRHLMMIVNTMTRGGYIMPLSRHGINRMDTGPLLRSSFEETPDVLCDAACFGEVDMGKGVSQNIMTGQLAPIGSGLTQFEMHTSLLNPRMIEDRSSMSELPRVLKSVARAINVFHPQIELHQVNVEGGGVQANLKPIGTMTSFTPNSSAVTMVPNFSTEDAASPSIFGSVECEMPFDAEDATLFPTTDCDDMFVPSSPSRV